MSGGERWPFESCSYAMQQGTHCEISDAKVHAFDTNRHVAVTGIAVNENKTYC